MRKPCCGQLTKLQVQATALAINFCYYKVLTTITFPLKHSKIFKVCANW